MLRHALRNALLPVYTSLTLSLGVLASGAVVVETVFSYPGLGRVVYEGVLARDYPLLQGAFLLVTLGVVGANLLADLTYPLLDPRVAARGPPDGRHASPAADASRASGVRSPGSAGPAPRATLGVVGPLPAAARRRCRPCWRRCSRRTTRGSW